MRRHFFKLITILFCLALSAPAQVTTDVREMARQLAAAANDKAPTLQERQDALQKLEEAARLFLSVDEKVEAARVLNRAGRLHLLLSSPPNAIATHTKALALLNQAPSVETEIDNLNGIAAAYMLTQDRSPVADTLNRALVLSEQSGYTRGQAEALLTFSSNQNYDNHARALETGQRALALWQSLGDKEGLARSYEQLGLYHMAQNTLAESTQNYEQSLQHWRDLNNSPGQAGVLINLGFIELRKGEWQSSISRFIQAQSLIDEKAEPEKMGQIASGMAEVYNEHGLPEDGLTHYERALNYYRQSQNSHLIWYGTWGIGWTYYLLQRYPEALNYLEQSLTLVESNGPQAALGHEYIGMVRMETGEYPAALQALEFALAIYIQAGNPMEAARVQGLIGQVFEQQGQFAQARQNYLKALATFTRISDSLNEATINHLLGRLNLSTGNYKEAEDYLLRSIALTEKINRISSSRDLNTAFHGSFYDRYKTYIECLMRKHQMAPNSALLVRAFEMSETARARSLAEFLRTTHTNFAPGVDPDLAQREKSLRQAVWQKVEYRSQLLSNPQKHMEELKTVNAELSRLETEYGQLATVINERFPAYRQITQPVSWDLRRIQQEVIKDDQTLLLEFSLGATKSYAWAVTRNGIKVYELPKQEAITEAVKRVTELLALPPVADTENRLAQASRELSQMILSPLAAELNKQTLIVVADGALNYVPFQILPVPSSDEPLVVRYDIVNAPSASILGDLREEAGRRQAATKLLAAFGDPVFHPTYVARNIEDSGQGDTTGVTRWRSAMRDMELNRDTFDPSVIPPLFYAARELANLRELAGGGGLVLSDFAATRERLLNTDLTQFAMLHLATHGFLDPKRPEHSGLLLSTVDNQGGQIEGFIGLQDIYELRAPVLMVVLSACQTALGKDVRGEGLVGITRGFMYAGASSVVASLWKVDDGATAELMKLFYSNMLQRGMKPATALREAQNSIRQKPQWRSPYYWGAFTLQGEYAQIIKPTSQAEGLALHWKIIGALSLLILLAGAAWWFRRRRLASAT